MTTETLDKIYLEWSQFTQARTARELELFAALTKLSNEVMGSLPLMEPLARRELGNANYNILIQRAEEARAAIAKAEAQTSGGGVG